MSRFIDLGKLWEAWQGDPEKKVSVKKEWLREVHSRLVRLEELEALEKERYVAAVEFSNTTNFEDATALIGKLFSGMEPDKVKSLLETFRLKV